MSRRNIVLRPSRARRGDAVLVDKLALALGASAHLPTADDFQAGLGGDTSVKTVAVQMDGRILVSDSVYTNGSVSLPARGTLRALGYVGGVNFGMCKNRSSLLGVVAVLLALFLVASGQGAPPPLDAWQWRNPRPQGNDLHAVIHAGGRFVAVGDHGSILYAFDGARWNVRSLEIGVKLVDVAHGNGVFVAVGEEPAPPHADALSVFRGSDPNGAWRLYVFDNESEDVGIIDQGWELTLHLQDPAAIQGTVIRQIARNGNQVDIHWEAFPDWRLQRSGSVLSPEWTDVPGTLGASRAQLPMTATNEFFRVIR